VHVNAGDTTVLIIGMEASASQLDQVVVSAGRYEQRVGEVTQSLSVLQPELLRQKNIMAFEDGIAQVPGVVVVDDDPQIRSGSGYSFGAGSRVMMLVDDLPILSGDIGRPSWNFLPIENLEQVEVIKGASSVLYGSAALSGVINVRTAYPRLEPKTRATVFAGMYDTPGNPASKWWDQSAPLMNGGSFFHSRQIGRFDLVLGGNAFMDQSYIGPAPIDPDTLVKDPLRMNPSGNYENRIRFNIATRWRSAKVPGLNYGVNANVMKSRTSTVLVWNNLDTGFYRAAAGTLTRTLGTQYYIDPFVNYFSPDGTRHKLRARYYFLNNENDNRQANKSNFLFAEYQVQHAFPQLGGLRVTAGVSSQTTTSDSQLYSGDPSGTGKNDASTVAGYLQLDKKFFDERLVMNAGGRYERFRVNDYEKAQPVFRAGATYRVLSHTYVRASFGQGFRFPTIGERYIRTSAGSLNIYPNADLAPETSTSIEGGIKQGFSIGRFQGYVDAVAFRQDYDQYVEFTFSQWDTPTFTNAAGLGFKSVNTGGARITGYEVELSGKGSIGPIGITTLMGYTHTLPVSTTPDQVYARSIPFFGVSKPVTYANTSWDTTDYTLKYRVTDLVRADVQLTWKQFFIGSSVRYNSHVRNIDMAFVTLDDNGLLRSGVREWMETHTTGDLIVDGRLGARIADGLTASLVVNNLTDRVYAIRPMAAEAPRVWQITLAYEH
jgi:iron complex outermembrane receptor protein